ncbi:MAG: hypothetical protein WAN93_00595 [Solirubrobacteraceae bacterium]
MFSVLRTRLTYANVAMTLALVFAMSGGAYAASKILITSTKQISPKVLKSLQGKAGANGAQGPVGPVGAAGPQGPTGPSGAAGASGVKGEAGSEGKEGKVGKEGKAGLSGSPWTAGGTLPSGKSETGIWAFGPVETKYASVTVPVASFPIELAAPLAPGHAHFINEKGLEVNLEEEEVPSVACQGTADEPTAEPGNLCVYTTHLQNSANTGSTAIGTVKRAGAVMFFGVTSPAEVEGHGTWAVTAAE